MNIEMNPKYIDKFRILFAPLDNPENTIVLVTNSDDYDYDSIIEYETYEDALAKVKFLLEDENERFYFNIPRKNDFSNDTVPGVYIIVKYIEIYTPIAAVHTS